VRHIGNATQTAASLADAWSGGICSNGAAGAPCNTDGDCGSGLICLVYYGTHVCAQQAMACRSDSECGGGECHLVEDDRRICVNGENGGTCLANSSCASHHCYLGALLEVRGGDDYGICVSGDDGSGCDAADDCNSGVCYNSDGWGQVCIGPSSESGSPCIPGQDRRQCANGLECNSNSQTCIQPASNSAGSAAR